MQTPRESTTPISPHMPTRQDAVVARVRSEFAAMPGLRLSQVQAKRLFGLPIHECERALEHLVSAGYLTRVRNAYQRRSTT